MDPISIQGLSMEVKSYQEVASISARSTDGRLVKIGPQKNIKEDGCIKARRRLIENILQIVHQNLQREELRCGNFDGPLCEHRAEQQVGHIQQYLYYAILSEGGEARG